MAEKCQKNVDTLTLCDALAFGVSEGFFERQSRVVVAGVRTSRQVVAVRKGKRNMLLHYCPFCRKNITTDYNVAPEGAASE